MSTVKKLRVSLGTLVAVEATAGCQPVADAAVEAAFAAIAAVDRRMHPSASGSDLARINCAPLHSAVTVDPGIHQLLQLAHRLNNLTEGVFDPCLPAQPGRLRDVELAADSVTCRLRVALDFGGFAKGYAVDRAIEALKSAGCVAGLVNAGGDLRIFGRHPDPILLRGPHGQLTRVDLSEAALAVSDACSQRRPPEHQGYYVRKSAGAPDCSANTPGVDPLVTPYAAVVASEACVADALSKCVLLCPREMADKALHAFGASRLAVQ